MFYRDLQYFLLPLFFQVFTLEELIQSISVQDLIALGNCFKVNNLVIQV